MMRKIQVAAFTFFLLSLPCNSYGEIWWVADISDKAITYIDIESIKNTDANEKRSWSANILKDGKSSKTLSFYNCEKEEYGIKARYSYNPDKSLESQFINNHVTYAPAAPGTIGYELLKISCSENPASRVKKYYNEPLKNEVDPSDFSKSIFEIIENSQKPPKS